MEGNPGQQKTGELFWVDPHRNDESLVDFLEHKTISLCPLFLKDLLLLYEEIKKDERKSRFSTGLFGDVFLFPQDIFFLMFLAVVQEVITFSSDPVIIQFASCKVPSRRGGL